ncbi:RNA polymerase sigma factor [Fusibacter sp. 3D3]|uniref:RNA polymerase sigma factor n=1 Tax=Fusibacter sp. 3D3 TaxID=1048380 RepID=UPI000852E04D|nr:RNA polymerase sigma factor [Fusibacter sp. 3D3]GAU78432.1 RNA polymerase sigma factor RpoE [Fusibacter sp. 3D3]
MSENVLETSHLDASYASQYKNLYQVAFRITGSIHDAEDVMQEAYINAFKGFDSFGGRSAISTWLYRITVNCALKYMKPRKNFPVERMAADKGVTVEFFFESLKDFRQVEDEVLYNDMRETCVHMFTECLPTKQRLTFVLRVIMDLSVADTAAILEISESAVKTNLYRARVTLRQAMDGKCAFIDPKFPCKCKLWVNYAIENNRRDLIASVPVINRNEKALENQILSEMNFLKKVSILYRSELKVGDADVFIKKMKSILNQSEMKVLKS